MINGDRHTPHTPLEFPNCVSFTETVNVLEHLAQGHYGDYKAVGEGVYELRFFFGSGYRVYFAEDGNTIVVLLLGGDKGSQSKDITKAQRYWKDYRSQQEKPKEAAKQKPDKKPSQKKKEAKR
jgi:putative addiction module killer protein